MLFYAFRRERRLKTSAPRLKKKGKKKRKKERKKKYTRVESTRLDDAPIVGRSKRELKRISSTLKLAFDSLTTRGETRFNLILNPECTSRHTGLNFFLILSRTFVLVFRGVSSRRLKDGGKKETEANDRTLRNNDIDRDTRKRNACYVLDRIEPNHN